MRHYLALFGLAVALPALAFSIYLLARYAALEDARQKSDVLLTTFAVSANIDNEISNDITTLRVLATSPFLDSERYAEFHRRASAALEGTGSYVILLDTDLQQLLNTHIPYGAPLGRLDDPRPVRAALESRQPYISNMFYRRIAEQPVVDVILPVLRGETVEYILIMARDVRSLARRIRLQTVDRRWTVTLTDRNNAVIAHSDPRHAFVVPAMLPPSTMNDSRAEGIGTVKGPDGQEVLYAFHRSNLTGWRVFVSIPTSIVRSAFSQTWFLFVPGGLVILGLTILLALLFGRFMERPVRNMAHEAAKLGRGETITATSTPIREINEVSSALASASVERRNQIEHIEMLLRELAHRAKNQLTVIQALAAQTAKVSDSVKDFQNRFQERLEGMTRSIELVQKQNWQGAPLAELARQQLEPFARPDGARVRLDGPGLVLNPAAAEHLGLALHELATNAAKHGAWSVLDGLVEFQWQIENKNSEPPRFCARWHESGGPPVSPPTRRGFGTVVIDRMICYALNGAVTMAFEPNGFRWELTCPAASVLAEPG